MTDAYRCDFCGEFETGKPANTLYERAHDRAQNETYTEAYHLCAACNENAGVDDA